MKKSELPKTSKQEDGVDWISEMPDGILLLILSRLSSTEEQIRTSILSRRWRYLWTAIRFVHIDVRYKGIIGKNKSRKGEFKEFAYWVLENKSVDLDRVKLVCEDYYSMSTVGRWIQVAVTRNVKKLELGFRAKSISEYVEMPDCLVTCGSLEVLKLCTRHLKLPHIMGFPALRVLDFTFDLFEDGDVIKGFFGSLPLLEDLTFTDCYMIGLDLLCLPCPKLKSLTIKNSMDVLMCGGIKICCPKLVDLVLKGCIGNNIFFECVESLKKAVIRPKPKLEGSSISGLFPGISGVEHLSIDPYFYIQGINVARDPALPNLKTLVLKTTMEAFTMDNLNQILKYCSKLEALRVIIEEDYYEKYEWSDDDERYGWLDDDETRSLFTPDVERIEYFEFKGEEPELVIDWSDRMLEMFFTWGDEARFSRQWL